MVADGKFPSRTTWWIRLQRVKGSSMKSEARIAITHFGRTPMGGGAGGGVKGGGAGGDVV